MSKPIRRNKDGTQNLNDLRKALNAASTVAVYQDGSNWIISTLIDNAWHTSPCPYWYDERKAIQHALFREIESDEEVAAYRRR